MPRPLIAHVLVDDDLAAAIDAETERMRADPIRKAWLQAQLDEMTFAGRQDWWDFPADVLEAALADHLRRHDASPDAIVAAVATWLTWQRARMGFQHAEEN